MPRADRLTDPKPPRASRPRTATVQTAPKDDAAEKNRPLMEDIRLLGRILGDVIREQDGR